MDGEKFYPAVENLGRECEFWSIGELATGCCFPKAEMQGRTSCEGIIDDVCLYLRTRRQPASLSQEEILELKLRAPDLDTKPYIPPGSTEA